MLDWLHRTFRSPRVSSPASKPHQPYGQEMARAIHRLALGFPLHTPHHRLDLEQLEGWSARHHQGTDPLLLEVRWKTGVDERRAIAAQLRATGVFVAMPNVHPAISGFPADWSALSSGKATRAIFVLSAQPLCSPLLASEPPQSESLRARCSDVWLDVGAHRAETTLRHAEADASLTVYAFEPNTKLCAALHQAATNLHALPLAVSLADGYADLRLNAYDASSSLLPMDERARERWQGGNLLAEQGTQLVPTTRLDTFMAQRGIAQVDWLKIDAQGADDHVIRSLGDRACDVARLTCEVATTDRQLYKGAAPKAKIVERLQRRGFTLVETISQSHGQEENLTWVRGTDWTTGQLSPYLSDATLMRLANDLCAPLQALEARPGWSMHDCEHSELQRDHHARAVWKEARRRGAAMPLRMRWWAGTTFEARLGNDLSGPRFLEGRFDPSEFAWLDQVLRPGMNVVDVGANEGLYSMFMAAKVGPQGRVLALEPSARERARLERNVALNGFGHVQVSPLALTEQPGHFALRLGEPGHAGLNTLGHFPFDMKQAGQEMVEGQTLDRLLLPRVDLIKLDCEGAELRALKGAIATIRRDHPMLLLEVNDAALRAQGTHAGALLAWLRTEGYTLQRFNGPMEEFDPATSENLFAVWSGQP